MTNQTRQPRQKLAILERKAVRTAIVNATGWDDYRIKKGINSSHLTGEALFLAADALGVNVASLVSGHTRAVKDAMPAVFKGDGTAPKLGGIDPQRVREIAREEIALRVKPVEVVKRIVVTPQRTYESGTAIKHPQFDNLLAAINVRDFSGNRLNCYLYGPTGTGKTYACAQLAQIMGLQFYFHSTAQEAYDLIGYEKVSGELMTTPFVVAFEFGGVCLLDEMDRYDEKALTVVNAGLANGKLTLPNGRVIKRHDDFICIGAGNTNGLGATADFTAATRLDKSTLSRFTVKLPWGMSPALEDMAAAKRSQNPAIAALWLGEVRAARKALDRLGLPDVADQRCVEAGANLLAAGMGVEAVRQFTYLSGFDDDQVRALRNLVGSDAIRPGQIVQARDADTADTADTPAPVEPAPMSDDASRVAAFLKGK